MAWQYLDLPRIFMNILVCTWFSVFNQIVFLIGLVLWAHFQRSYVIRVSEVYFLQIQHTHRHPSNSICEKGIWRIQGILTFQDFQLKVLNFKFRPTKRLNSSWWHYWSSGRLMERGKKDRRKPNYPFGLWKLQIWNGVMFYLLLLFNWHLKKCQSNHSLKSFLKNFFQRCT